MVRNFFLSACLDFLLCLSLTFFGILGNQSVSGGATDAGISTAVMDSNKLSMPKKMFLTVDWRPLLLQRKSPASNAVVAVCRKIMATSNSRHVIFC